MLKMDIYKGIDRTKNIDRSIRLIKNAIESMQLDLKGCIIFTEAASGEYMYTPLIAAMGGADKVYAICKNSKYGLKAEIKKEVEALARICGVEKKVVIVEDKQHINEAHIVTNLGFVRPIDSKTIDVLREEVVIPYMCEAWEVREQDIDIDYCRKKNIPVAGTNENFEGVDVFNYSGLLCMKMLFDCGIEIYKSKIVIVSSDNFGKVIFEFLSKLSEDVILIEELLADNLEDIKNIDALIIADYVSEHCFIGGKDSLLSCEMLKSIAPDVMVVQFAGSVDIRELDKSNIRFYPNYYVGKVRMGKTLAYLGPRPVIDLHCAGLKVGELLYKQKNGIKIDDEKKYMGLIQKI